ncbi:MAG: hypothetical protein LBU87_06510 [Lactobacillales bacterium]|jgi:hypothetical protein|nr:hypothetical protein [Lactobacillales bacterium]
MKKIIKDKIKVSPITDKEKLKKKGFGKAPAKWEDSMRTNGGKGSFEWWYTDAHFKDGSTLVAVFFTKSLQEIDSPLTPEIEIIYTPAKGKEFNKLFRFSPSEFKASKDQCDVNIGKNYFRGDLKKYEIHIEDEETGACFDLVINRQTESWRAGDGCFYYGNTGKYLGWFVAVPQGKMDAIIKIGGKIKKHSGSAYHDHNWGNVGMPEIINHWYWSRAEIGPYTVINSNICCPKMYDLAEWGCAILAKDGKILSDDASCQQLFRSTPHVQPVTGKLVSDIIKFINIDKKGDGYELTLIKDHNISDDEKIKNPFVRAIAEIAGKNVGYHRMIGTAELKMVHKGCTKKVLTNDAAVWEMMSFADPE